MRTDNKPIEIVCVPINYMDMILLSEMKIDNTETQQILLNYTKSQRGDDYWRKTYNYVETNTTPIVYTTKSTL